MQLENGSTSLTVEITPLGALNIANNAIAEKLIDMVQSPVMRKKLIGLINSINPQPVVEEGAETTEPKPGEQWIAEIESLMGQREAASRELVRRALQGK